MQHHIKFGPSGNSKAFYDEGYTSTTQAPKWINALGLKAFEYSFGRGVRLTQPPAEAIAQEAKRYDIQLSVHLPYFINLATLEDEKQLKNIEYFLQSLQVAHWLGAKRAVFHPGSAAKQPREKALEKAIKLFKRVLDAIRAENLGHISLCPETMGKINQLGDLDEVIALCRVDESVIPCIDFGHLYCRSLGALQTKEDYAAVLACLKNGVGEYRAKNMHIHFSRMEFTAGGEKMHHRFKDTQFGPEFHPLAELLAEGGYTPVVICESKDTMAEDACKMMEIYNLAKNKVQFE